MHLGSRLWAGPSTQVLLPSSLKRDHNQPAHLAWLLGETQSRWQHQTFCIKHCLDAKGC